MHWPFEGVKYPVELFVENVAVPEADEPVTVTVHVVNDPTCIVLEEQDMASEAVVRVADGLTTDNEKLPVAPVLYTSPGYEAEMSAVVLEVAASVYVIEHVP